MNVTLRAIVRPEGYIFILLYYCSLHCKFCFNETAFNVFEVFSLQLWSSAVVWNMFKLKCLIKLSCLDYYEKSAARSESFFSPHLWGFISLSFFTCRWSSDLCPLDQLIIPTVKSWRHQSNTLTFLLLHQRSSMESVESEDSNRTRRFGLLARTWMSSQNVCSW